MTARATISGLADLPWFADDEAIGIALLGRDRACEWKSLAPLYERQGLPKIDEIMGGRYVPAVKAFFDKQYGLASLVPEAPDGVENPAAWKSGRRRLA